MGLVREALDKELRKAKDIIHYIRTKIVDMAKNFKCTDALPEDVCAKIKEIAAKFKVDYQKVMKVIKDIIAKGITKVKEIIDEIKKHFFPQLEGELVNLVKCEDVLSPQVCTKMREIAAKLKIKVSEVDRIIRELVAKKITAKEVDEIIKKIVVAGVTKAEEIIKKIIEHF